MRLGIGRIVGENWNKRRREMEGIAQQIICEKKMSTEK